jgi:hypothetical protein
MRAGGALAAAAVVVVLGSACYDPFSPGACTTEAVAGISVVLRGEGGQSLTADDADGRAVEEGGEVAELESFFDQLIGAWERAGTYTVTVDKPGFESWVRDDVEVEAGECHVVPVRLEAVLSPES